jgi:hypothetical protein
MGKQINGLLGLLKGKVLGGGGPRLGPLGLFFFSFLNQTGSVRLGLVGSGTPKSETEPNIFLNILTGSISFFYRFDFFG